MTLEQVEPQISQAIVSVEQVLQDFTAGLAALLGNPVQCKKWLSKHQTLLDQAFRQGADVEELVRGRARLIDAMLAALWQYQSWDDKQELSLIAVGGYGRGELHPQSGATQAGW